MRLDLGDLIVRTLTVHDPDLLVEATRTETGKALWGPHPTGPYTRADAVAALRTWDPDRGGQTSFGVFAEDRLVGALGLMPDAPGSAELAYWVRPESRGQGIAVRSVQAITDWALAGAVHRVWLEINPTNRASQRVAERTGFALEELLPRHCRAWIAEDPEQDLWHDCLIWARGPGPSR